VRRQFADRDDAHGAVVADERLREPLAPASGRHEMTADVLQRHEAAAERGGDARRRGHGEEPQRTRRVTRATSSPHTAIRS
jgi:hypothetical protein